MTSDVSQLPPGFENLERFVAMWAAPCAAERARRRGASTEADRTRFYAAGKEMLVSALAYLDKKPLGQLDPKEQTLLNLMLSLCHVSLAVELQGQEESNHTKVRELMRITRTSSGPTVPADAPQPDDAPSTTSVLLTVEQLQRRIDESAFSIWLGLRVTAVFAQTVEFQVPWREEFIGTARLGRTHGGVIAALVDAACGYTLMARTGQTLSTVDLRVDFHRGSGSGDMLIEGRVVHSGRKLACVDVRVMDASGTLLSSGRGTYYTPSERSTTQTV